MPSIKKITHILSSTFQRERLPLTLAASLTLALYLALPASASPPRAEPTTAATTTAPVYPRKSATLRAAHAQHADLPCARCHAEIARSTAASQRHTPTMERCAECHAATAKPALSDCGACHVGATQKSETPVTKPEHWRAFSPAPMRLPTPQADLKFSHAAHAETDCARCHTPDAQGAPTLPSMSSCQSCHDGATAAASCTTCHYDRQLHGRSSPSSGSTSRTGVTAKRGVTTPPSPLVKRLVPEDHAHDWLEQHGSASRARPQECAECHTETSCTGCHNDRSGQLLIVHPPNYLVLHRVASRSQEQNCADCHRNEATCLECHTQLRAAPATSDSPGPPAAITYHPPGWLDPASATHHGVMAKRNLNECTSCHQERDCVSCHQGISPHAPDFLSRCEHALKSNPLPCLKCHTDGVTCP